ncbi:transcriptional regulator [Listeria floridensis FSL S10-1187]|uniref:Transcriptional regulator n=1 Tax=Listeria floridensis FSL S10-1187 TaxID=1265817 RepID=A0ABP3AX44_9LIST|nr:ROK family protein [Listeria floridensis]EUJ30741.1 transcriptional regulator [Listeria floridensis FSL S10-1187]
MGPSKKIKTPQTLNAFQEELVRIYLNQIDEIAGVAVSMPGVIDEASGFALHGGSLRFIRSQSVLELYRSFFGVPVAVQNDAKAALAGEMFCGNLKTEQSAAMIVLGTGVGGAVMIGRKILSGFHHSAGELSLIKTSTDLETPDFLAVKNGIEALLRPFAAAKQISLNETSGEAFFEAIQNDDPDASTILQNFTDALAAQIWNIQAILDPEKIVIGGGISSQSVLLDYIQRSLNKLTTPLKPLEELLETVQPNVTLSSLGNNANLLGAYHHYLNFQSH